MCAPPGAFSPRGLSPLGRSARSAGKERGAEEFRLCGRGDRRTRKGSGLRRRWKKRMDKGRGGQTRTRPSARKQKAAAGDPLPAAVLLRRSALLDASLRRFKTRSYDTGTPLAKKRGVPVFLSRQGAVRGRPASCYCAAGRCLPLRPVTRPSRRPFFTPVS